MAYDKPKVAKHLDSGTAGTFLFATITLGVLTESLSGNAYPGQIANVDSDFLGAR